jgi:hypothetical protein
VDDGFAQKRPFTTAETVLRTFEASGHLNLTTVAFKFWRPPRRESGSAGGLSGFQALFFIPSRC